MKNEKPKAYVYYYSDNWGGDIHYFETLDGAKCHAKLNNMGAVIIRKIDNTHVCTVIGERYFA